MPTYEQMKPAILAYQKTQKALRIWVAPDELKEYQDAAMLAGSSLRQYVRDALSEKMDRDNAEYAKEADAQGIPLEEYLKERQQKSKEKLKKEGKLRGNKDD